MSFGCPYYYKVNFEPALKAFSSRKCRSIMSTFLAESTKIKRFYLAICSRYLNDLELRKILTSIGNMRELLTWDFKGNFAGVTKKGLNDFQKLVQQR